MEFSFGNIFTKAYWKETAIPFAKKHWVLIVAVLTALSLAHTIWYFTVDHPLSEIADKFKKHIPLKKKGRLLKEILFHIKWDTLLGLF